MDILKTLIDLKISLNFQKKYLALKRQFLKEIIQETSSLETAPSKNTEVGIFI